MVVAMKSRSACSNLRRAMVAVLLAFGVCGCGAAGRTASHVGDDVAHLPRPHVEAPIPHVNGDEAAVAARQAEILSPADDLSLDDRLAAIDIACRFKTIYDLSRIEDDEELVYKASLEFGGDTTKGARAVALVRDLQAADDPSDVIGQAAAAGICGV
jgi:hypothetical protein